MIVLAALLVVMATSLVIMVACATFEEASGYLGRNLPPGVRGATLNAIGSSLPELLTTAILLFAYHDHDGYAAGIATCIGSAIFNAVVIPALCVLAVLVKGAPWPGGDRRTVDSIGVGRPTILRDGLVYVAAVAVVAGLLGAETLTWRAGLLLLGLYSIYVAILVWQTVRYDEPEVEVAMRPPPAPGRLPERLRLILRLDFNRLLFGPRPLNSPRAWVVLSLATGTIALACYGLSWAVVASAAALGVPVYFTAVILAAGATSVPDTVLSVKDALDGQYDDAISNAFGSNIFDITVALGLPLLAYGLIFGPVSLAAEGGADIQHLVLALLGVTVLVLALFLSGRRLGRGKAWTLLGVYALWTAFVVWSGWRA